MMPARTHEADLERVARALGGRKLVTGGWSCRCPAHDDRNASLSLSVNEGRLLWRCHAGCGQADVQAALERDKLIDAPRSNGHALPLRAIAGGRPPPPHAMDSIGRIVATYDYRDVTGALLFQVVRFEPKTFRQRRPKGSGWEWGLGRVQPVLYRLPELAGAETVYVTEGEKDADRLRALGLSATTSPMGAGKWRDEYGQALAGKHVVVLPDNDEPGRRHAEQVAPSAIAGGAASVRVLELPKLGDHGDPSDWLDAGGTRDQLEALVRDARPWRADEDGAGDPGWRSRLITGDNGTVGCEANVETALRHAPELIGRLRYDAFRNSLEVRDPPWARSTEWREWQDSDDVELAMWCQRASIIIPPLRCLGVALAVGKRSSYHPARDYLRSLKWDGVFRIDDWLNTYLGVAYKNQQHMEYVRAAGAKWLVSAVARIMRPGCKVDTALILEGPQGIGKSTAVRVMAGDQWFADQIADLHGKDSAQDLRGKWVIELGELSAMKGRQVETVKAFMSRSTDHYRPSYERAARDFPRQTVFMGSTNRDDYLDDEENRRFWPVTVGRIDLKALRRDRGQLWAEAVARYDAGEQWWLERDVLDAAKVEQADRVQVDPWSQIVSDWADKQTGTDFAVHEILRGAIGIKDADMGQREMNRMVRILRSLEWTREKQRVGKSWARFYRRPVAGRGG